MSDSKQVVHNQNMQMV